MNRPGAVVTAALVSTLTVFACTLDLDSVEGRACNAEHTCPEPFVCQELKCVASTSTPTPTPPLYDDAGIVWRQSVEGFDERSAGVGCDAGVDSAHGNRLSIETLGPSPSDRASARVLRDRLAQTEQGTLGGKFRFTGELPYAETGIINVRTRLGEDILAIAVTPPPSASIGVRSSAGVLGGSGLATGLPPNLYSDVSALFVSGAENRLEFRWAKTKYVKILLNGSLLDTLTFTGSNPTTPLGAAPAIVELGVQGCSDCAPDGGYHLEFWDWKYSGDENADLGP